MNTYHGIIGNINTDPDLHTQYHQLGDKVEKLVIEPGEVGKSRLRRKTDKGTDVGIVIERGTKLADGDILEINDERAIVIHVKPETYMVININKTQNRNDLISHTVRLGHILGNQHWPITVEDETVYVPMSIDPAVMETVLKTYGAQGITYAFREVTLKNPPVTSGETHEHA